MTAHGGLWRPPGEEQRPPARVTWEAHAEGAPGPERSRGCARLLGKQGARVLNRTWRPRDPCEAPPGRGTRPHPALPLPGAWLPSRHLASFRSRAARLRLWPQRRGPQREPRSSHTVCSQASSPRPAGPRGLVRRPPGRTRPRPPRPGLSERQSRCDAEGSRRARRGPAPSLVRADFLRDTPLPSLWGRALPARSAALGLSSSPGRPCALMVPRRARPSRAGVLERPSGCPQCR